MWLPFLPHLRRSKQNGWIFVTSKGEVWVDGVKQTSARYADLWLDAFVRCEDIAPKKVSTVLMLGLAGGGALRAIDDAYEGATVTAIEFDPTMVAIAKELHKNKPYPFPTVVVADAKEALEAFDTKFDIILIDIFTGIRPSAHIDDDHFWHLVAGHLNPGGIAVLNVAIDSTRMYVAQNHFKNTRAWYYDANAFCALWN